MFFPGMGPMGMPMMMGPPMMGAPMPNRQVKKKKLDVTAWRSWSGDTVVDWLVSLKLPPAFRYTFPIIAKNFTGDRLPKVEVEDLIDIDIKRPHAKQLVEHFQSLKNGNSKHHADSKSDDDDDDKPVFQVEPFKRPSYIPDEKYDFFLSHRGTDTKDLIVRPLAKILQDLGVTCFFDREIEVGLSNEDAVARGLYQAQYGLIFFSGEFLDSKWCVKELLTLYSRTQYDPGFKAAIPVFWDVDVGLHNVSPFSRKVFEHYKEATTALTKTAGIELKAVEPADVAAEFEKKLIPQLFKALGKQLPSASQLRRIVRNAFPESE